MGRGHGVVFPCLDVNPAHGTSKRCFSHQPFFFFFFSFTVRLLELLHCFFPFLFSPSVMLVPCCHAQPFCRAFLDTIPTGRTNVLFAPNTLARPRSRVLCYKSIDTPYFYLFSSFIWAPGFFLIFGIVGCDLRPPPTLGIDRRTKYEKSHPHFFPLSFCFTAGNLSSHT